jgi:hypothetical protein
MEETLMKIRKSVLGLMCATICILCMTGCGVFSDNSEENTSAIEISMDDEKFNNTLYTVIREGSDEGSAYLVDGFMLDPRDKCNGIEIKESYICDNAVYVKIDTNGVKYLYRFQLDNYGLIESYIKYEVED